MVKVVAYNMGLTLGLGLGLGLGMVLALVHHCSLRYTNEQLGWGGL